VPCGASQSLGFVVEARHQDGDFTGFTLAIIPGSGKSPPEATGTVPSEVWWEFKVA
jgi:hypothetical protein